MDKIYLEARQKESYTSYRLNKRTDVIVNSLKEFMNDGVNCILDVGTADGKMLHRIAAHFNIKLAVGIDTSEEGIELANQFKDVKVFLGNFINLPFKKETFDLLIASAVLEHIEDVNAVLKESYRVLKNGGLICITLPNPFFDWINSKLVTTYHVKRYSLGKIIRILQNCGFNVVKESYFMLNPFGKMIFSEYLERFFRAFRLNFLLFNHITIGRKI